jgi:hypothetical protein
MMKIAMQRQAEAMTVCEIVGQSVRRLVYLW